MRLDELYSLGGRRDVKVAVGAGLEREGYTQKVIDSVRKIEDRFNVVVVGYNDVGGEIDFVESERPEELITEMLVQGEVDAVVRGTLGAEKTLSSLKDLFSLNSLYRVAVLETLHPTNKVFLLAPVGIDEGETVDEKVKFGLLSISLLNQLDMDGKIAVLSGGRAEDFGRSERVDLTLKQAKELTEKLKKEGVEAINHQILIEDAIKDSNMIIPPDGITGNLIFRTLTFLGDGKAIGAPIMNIDKTYIDTSRASDNYEDSIALAAALAKFKNKYI
ncbi:methanogenesis marker protein Mmp4/MtxX [Methanonatronarchaeum sp. AMET-Sl]|uniref:methanogenesis marker protein Mmp4/MtxX n=1 Tax=Methanonatronarchaeum sp. AMET-Sl TaxID=3037654 RepID=UPI00244E5A79|nr:methanogenesis marker protein Mmp4/MtxX [Methanonatronarchaeum sp. AMET-Sl]WGI17533.1 methanogenesis marker protein Mmp4/MtxX [Methanonatronarchaeum sp. AMET-Sl]